ncbi:hypothetical protein A2Z33_04325 [Candidatus Gottesmanbacteria bacterium RBG_16_52_11]|uniref:ATP synthase gamma chain n=1 Tax=Candidatus Gottesmanbacteria bacterium RBG_16_52_11 TaxID=1798374 RepID=A0A1F5YWT7_9BACT|nr:MAG: hypothetical protein A2Z33_04325 [Candidatus Gottesmanbacteria bacterium RBG_16_52_11]
MPTVSELKLELEDATTLKLISQAFTEASAARVQKIKSEFEKNAGFYKEISHLYHLVRASADRAGDQITSKKAAGKKPEDRKVLSVAFTSNQRFYGNLNINIMQKFLEAIKDKKTDICVIGLTGKDYMASVGYDKPFEKLQFAKDNPSKDEVRAFLDKSDAYDTVNVYYPKFVTLVSQTVGVTDITQEASEDKIPEDEIYVLFEPDLSQTLDFFKRQVRSLLFLRVVLESDLSRTAARLLTMSGAEERSTEMIKVKKSQLRKIQTSIINARLIETFAAIKGVRR